MPYSASFSCLWCQVKSSHKQRETKCLKVLQEEKDPVPPCPHVKPKQAKNTLFLTEKKTWMLLLTRDGWIIMLLCCITGPDLLYSVLESQNISFLSTRWVMGADPLCTWHPNSKASCKPLSEHQLTSSGELVDLVHCTSSGLCLIYFPVPLASKDTSISSVQ